MHASCVCVNIKSVSLQELWYACLADSMMSRRKELEQTTAAAASTTAESAH